MKIKPVDKDIKNILDSGYYKIPRFQRPYSWDRENLEDFWNDTIVSDEVEYFIGSMVAFKPKETEDIYYIVDGQQRLTTITLFLAALRDVMDEVGESGLATAVQTLIEKPDLDGIPTYILDSETPYPFLQEYIQKHGEPDLNYTAGSEEKNLEYSYDYLYGNINNVVKSIQNNLSLSDTNKKKNIKAELSKIRDRILRLRVIFVELDNEDDAYLIFETLNTRGKDLEVSDLVKNHLLRNMKSKTKQVDAARDKWNGILSKFDESAADISPNSFLHHFWLSKYDYVTEKKLFRDIKNVVKKSNAKEFLDELVDVSEIYRTIYEPPYRKWNKEEKSIQNSLGAMNLFRVRQQVPFVLSILRLYFSKDLTKKQTEKILRSIECFHFLFTAITSQRSSGGISFMYAAAARDLLQAQDKDERGKVLDDLRKKLHDRIPVFEEFMANFKEIYFSERFTKDRSLVRYIMIEVDRYFRNGKSVPDYMQMTIEHIAAQNSKGGPKIADEYIAELGNLILVPEDVNNDLANKDFQSKRAILEAHNLIMGPVLPGADEWGATQIQTRTEQLASVSYSKIWSI